MVYAPELVMWTSVAALLASALAVFVLGQRLVALQRRALHSTALELRVEALERDVAFAFYLLGYRRSLVGHEPVPLSEPVAER